MKELLLWEIQKNLKVKWKVAAVIFVLCFPLLFAVLQTYDLHRSEVLYQNEILSEYEMFEKEASYQREIAGPINRKWIRQQKEKASSSSTEGMDRYDEMLQTIAYQSEKQYEIRKRMLRDSEVPSLVRHDYETHELQFGPSQHWKNLLLMVSWSGLLYCFVLTALCMDHCNKENYYQTNELLQTTPLGKSSLLKVKIMHAFILAVGIGTLLIGILYLVGLFFYGYELGSASILSSRNIQPFTYQEIFQQGLALLLCGGLLSAFISTFFSMLAKDMIVSGIFSMIWMILPTITPDSIALTILQLIPTSFLRFFANGQLYSSPYLVVGNLIFHRTEFTIILVLILSAIMFIIGIHHERKYKR